jgi:diacylglycerol kinase family enzyme
MDAPVAAPSSVRPLTVIARVEPGPSGVRVRSELERALQRRSLAFRLERVPSTQDAAGRATEALERGDRFLVAVGDDELVQSVVNGMFRDGVTIVPEPILGIMAGGTANDLLRSFNLPPQLEGAVEHLAGDAVYPFDVMKITCRGPDGADRTRYATNLAQVGFGAAASIRAGRMPRALGDRGRAFLGFWSAYLRTRPTEVRVAIDTKSWTGRAFQVIVGNAQFASGLRLSPRSWPGDGVLDALAFTGPTSDAYTMMPRIMRQGDHVPDPNIREFRAKIRVAIDADRPLPVVADGVSFGTTPATFQLVPQQILFKI